MTAIIRLEWIKSLSKILQDPLFPQGEQMLTQLSRPAHDSLLLHSRWGRFEEFLRFGSENHFLRTLGLLRYLNSPSYADRVSGMRYLMQKLKKQNFNEKGQRLFLFYFLKLMVLSREENSLEEQSGVLTQLYEYYYRPVLAQAHAGTWLKTIPVVSVGYEDFKVIDFYPITWLMYFKVCGGRHLICVASEKQLQELYKAGRLLEIEIHAFEKNSIKWSQRISKSERAELVLQKEIHVQRICDANYYFSKTIRQAFRVKGHTLGLRDQLKRLDLKVKAPLQIGLAWLLGAVTLELWQGWLHRPGFLTGLGFASLWLGLSMLSSAISDIFTKHSLREFFSKPAEVFDDIKKHKATDNIFYSGLSIMPLYSLQQLMFLILPGRVSGEVFVVINFFVMSLANGFWSSLQRWWRGYFSKGVSAWDFFRGFFGYGVAGACSFLWPLGPLEYMVIAKIFKEGWSVFSEMLPGRREKTRERMNDIQLISKDLHDVRLERDIRKVLLARGLRGAFLPRQVRQCLVAMHLLYLGSGLSLGDDALMKFKRNAKFNQMLLASIQILRDPERMSRLLKIIFSSREMCQKAEKYYEDHFEQFIARYGRWSSRPSPKR
jgi:hypothetical protein